MRCAAVRCSVLVVATLLSGLGATARPAAAQLQPFEPVAGGFGFAVNLAFLPDGRVLVAEKVTGAILVVEDGRVADAPLATLPANAEHNESGLLGIAVDPASGDVLAYLSDARDGMNRLVRLRVRGGRATEAGTVFEAIATTAIHNGGDIAVGVDGSWFLVTGDAAAETLSQDLDDPRGKILRFEPSSTDEGPSVAPTVWASGVRNSFGLCVDPRTGTLYETENGPTAWDEINRVERGANLGWPDRLGPGGEPAFADPIVAFEEVIVPTGCAISRDGRTLYVGDFGGRLHAIDLAAHEIRDEVVATFDGAITDVAVSPEGELHVLTTTTLYRQPTDTGGPSDGGGDEERSSPTPVVDEVPASRPPSPVAEDDGIGSALGTTAGVAVLALLAAAFLWFRGRALRR